MFKKYIKPVSGPGITRVVSGYSDRASRRRSFAGPFARLSVIVLTAGLVTFGVYSVYNLVITDRLGYEKPGDKVVEAVAVPVDSSVVGIAPDGTPLTSAGGATSQGGGNSTLPGTSSGAGGGAISGGGSSIAGGTTNPAADTPSTACGNSDIPLGACDAMLSIERTGVKNNPYVTADTTQLPADTKATFNKSSWDNLSATVSTATAIVQALGQSRNVTVTFQIVADNSWKVTNYSVN